MPRIRRWFHVSHDINSDPEVWELTDRFGERAYRVWIEILSIADRYDGLVPGETKYLSSALAAKCKTKTKTVSRVLNYATDKQWLVNDPARRVRNHLKYRPTRGDKQTPRGEQLASPPLLHTPTHSSPIRKKSTLAHRGDERMNGFDAFWKEYPRKKSKGPAEKAWKRWRGEGVSRETILQALLAQRDELVERPADKIPYPATWLNAKSWENEPDADDDAIREGPRWEKAT